MGGLLDDILDIKDEFSGIKDDFTSFAQEDGSGREVREIWDPARFNVKPGIDDRLCLHHSKMGLECDLCERVCPAAALKIADGNISIDGSACIGCALCISECPTGSLIAPRVSPQALFKTIASNAVSYEASYITCARSLGHTPPGNVCVLPCLGCVSPQLWFSLLAAYDNISIYLPLGACDACECKVGEGLYLEAVSKAEKWAHESLGYECDESSLKTKGNRAKEKTELVREIAGSAVSFAGAVNPIARTAAAGLRQLDRYGSQITKMQGMLDKAAGEDGASDDPMRKRMLDPNRQLVLLTLKNYKDLAEGMKIALSKTDAGLCRSSAECVRACPVGARLIDESSGKATVASTFCIGCGACVDVCPSGAASLKMRSAKVLLQELSDLEKGVEKLKELTSGTADAIKKKLEM